MAVPKPGANPGRSVLKGKLRDASWCQSFARNSTPRRLPPLAAFAQSCSVVDFMAAAVASASPRKAEWALGVSQQQLRVSGLQDKRWDIVPGTTRSGLPPTQPPGGASQPTTGVLLAPSVGVSTGGSFSYSMRHGFRFERRIGMRSRDQPATPPFNTQYSSRHSG